MILDLIFNKLKEIPDIETTKFTQCVQNGVSKNGTSKNSYKPCSIKNYLLRPIYNDKVMERIKEFVAEYK